MIGREQVAAPSRVHSKEQIISLLEARISRDAAVQTDNTHDRCGGLKQWGVLSWQHLRCRTIIGLRKWLGKVTSRT
jgi:hypothetical protein